MKKKKPTAEHDVIIVGGGLAGLTLTALLATHDVKVLCIDRDAPDTQLKTAFDGRTTAVSYGSRKVLEAAGIWSGMAHNSCPISTIHIQDGDSPVLLEFNSSEVDDRTFGWIAENRLMRRAMFERVSALKTATHIAPAKILDFSRDEDKVTVHLEDGQAFSAPLVVGADGRGSFTREWMGIATRGWSYNQRAIVCTATHTNPHKNTAVENFRPEGPFAILPLTDDPKSGAHRSSIVWTEHKPEKDSAIHYDQDVFDAALNARFPDFYGNVHQIEKRFSYPLSLIHAHNYIAPRMALVADAAHGIHPIAGQGLNLGFRDIAALSTLVTSAVQKGYDPGGPTLLQNYQRQRRFDNMAMAGTCDGFVKLFSNNIAPVRIARRAGLRAVSRLPFAKRFFMKQAMGSAGILPDLIREKEAA